MVLKGGNKMLNLNILILESIKKMLKYLIIIIFKKMTYN